MAQAGRFHDQADIDQEAERIANLTWELGEKLETADPAILRQVFEDTITRIECRWKETPAKNGKKRRFELEEGRVILKDHKLFHVCNLVGRYLVVS